jgi:putative PIN family toxin of toxin-antitoxin system
MFASDEIKKEIYDVLTIKFKLPHLDATNILTDFSSVTIPTKVSNHIFIIEDDPDDNKFIECALKCKANLIISGDKHLLNLGEYESIKILAATDFLKLIDCCR